MLDNTVAACDFSVTLRHVEQALEESRAGAGSKSLLRDLGAAAGARVAAVAALDMFLVGIDTVSAVLGYIEAYSWYHIYQYKGY